MGELVKAKDGTGFRGLIQGENGQIVGQPVFVPAAGNSVKMTTKIPYDPTLLLIATTLISIEKNWMKSLKLNMRFSNF